MCGIAGLYGLNFANPEKEMFQQLLLINSLRGVHSTGVIRVDGRKAQHIRTLKAELPSWEFLSTDEGQRLIWSNTVDNPNDKTIWGKDPIGFIGHCRHATKGKVDVNNAHPFEFENVTGVHNGTIRGQFPHSEEYGTDSEALYRNINDVGIEEALKRISHLDAAYALVWVDKKNGTINFIRNSRRPLFFTFIYGRSTLVWSSDRDHLDIVVKASSSINTGWDAADKTGDGYFYLKPFQHMSIPLGEAATKATIKTLDITESFTAGVTTTTYMGKGHSYKTYKNTGMIKGPDGVLRSPTSHKEFMRKNKNTSGKYQGHHKTGDLSRLPWLNKELPPTDPGFGGEPLSTAELGFKLSCGCVSCGEKVKIEDVQSNKREVYWWSRDYYSCDNCYENSPGDWVRAAFGEGVAN